MRRERRSVIDRFKDMKKTRLIIALFIGSVFGGLSFLMQQLSSSGVIFFLFPGAIVGMAAAGNVHAFSARVVALGNFAFYFGLTYLLLALWRKYAAGPDNGKENSPL